MTQSGRLVRTIAREPAPQRDGLAGRVHERLVEDLDVRALDQLPAGERHAHVEAAVARVLAELAPAVAGVVRQDVITEVVDEILGFGPIQPLLDDPDITEIMVNGPSEVFYEREGMLYVSAVRFRDAEHIRRIADRITGPLGRRLDESSPMVDARLPDGSRVNVVLPPIAVHSPTITVRKFRTDRYDIEDLVSIGTVTREVAGFLRACVVSKVNIVISGGTGSGKTTFLNALSAFIPRQERVVTIEDPMEIRLRQPHVVTLEARPSAGEGGGEVTQRDLVRNALRMRPDRIIVGEVRSGEAFDMMQAMNTGHEGSITTVHSNSPRDALSRIENMVLMAGFELPALAIRQQMASALHLVVQISRMIDGTRRVTAVTEVVGLEGDIVAIQDVFKFADQALDRDGRVSGRLEPTGVRPRFADRFPAFGVSEDWIEPPSVGGAVGIAL
ncbi:MAG: CpaF family protein [Chloroflexi bacterium]|nr:CpaF family protein [Chloroflexota bacterium]